MPQKLAKGPRPPSLRNALVVDGPHLTLVTPKGSASGDRDGLRSLVRQLQASGPTIIVTPLKVESEVAPDLPETAYLASVQGRPGRNTAVPDGPKRLLSLNVTDEQLADLRSLLRGSPLTLVALTTPVSALARTTPRPAILLHAAPDLHSGTVTLLTDGPTPQLGRLRWQDDPETTLSFAVEELQQDFERDTGHTAPLYFSGAAASYAERIATGFGWTVTGVQPDEVGRAALTPPSADGLGALQLDVRTASPLKPYLPVLGTASLCAALSLGLSLVTQATQLQVDQTQRQIDALTPAVQYVQALKAVDDQRQIRLAQIQGLMQNRGAIASDLRVLANTLTAKQLGARLVKISGPGPVGTTLGFGQTPPTTAYDVTLTTPSRATAEDTIATLSDGPWRLNVRNLTCAPTGCSITAQLGTAPPQGATPPRPPS